MLTKRRCSRQAALFLTVVSWLFLSHCGYSLYTHAQLPFSEIRLAEIENRSTEPKLQDYLQRELADEFRKQGIHINPAAQVSLSGTVTSFSMVGIAEKNDIITEYQVNILADFRFTDALGKTREFKNIAPPFIVNVTGTKEFGILIANKEVAERLAMRDLAVRIVGALIYQ